MATSEGFVEVAPDSTGKQIRNLTATVVQPDGTYATVYMQVVSIVDANGQAIDWVDVDFKRRMLAELRAIRRGIEEIAGGRFFTLVPQADEEES